MSEKNPRIKPHAVTHIELARKGSEDYQYRTLPMTPDQQKKIGQMSITDGVFIPREAPPEPPVDA